MAGAGTGKTKTLIYRVARLVEENINPENILLLTFTRKAAINMLKRASAILDERCGKVSGGTFHSFANTLLRRYAKFVGFNENFTILDESDSESAIGIIRAKLGYNKTEKRFPLKHTITEVISKSVNKNIPIDFVLNTEYPHFMDSLDGIKMIQIEYQKYKKEKMLMDYDDLLLYLELLLRENEEIRKKISNFYKYIRVDEFHDTNKIQANIA
ncbi:MAG: UvrD-helicase domain-containing protein, partial [Actinobacteria bacterium]|nr:UvrD-helicase domain-containing protein [Actinomycetota bacterium]